MYVDVTIYPCQKLEAGLANLCWWKKYSGEKPFGVKVAIYKLFFRHYNFIMNPLLLLRAQDY